MWAAPASRRCKLCLLENLPMATVSIRRKGRVLAAPAAVAGAALPPPLYTPTVTPTASVVRERLHGQSSSEPSPTAPPACVLLSSLCPHCASPSGDIVEDVSSGDRVCRDCGYVLLGGIVSEDAEWREFMDGDDGGGGDPNRVGFVDTESKVLGLTTAATFRTVFQKRGAASGGGDGGCGSYDGATARQSALLKMFQDVQQLADAIRAPKRVVDAAHLIALNDELYPVLTGFPRETAEPTLLYAACRVCNFPADVDRIAGLCSVDAKALWAKFNKLKTTRPDVIVVRTIGPRDAATRLCAALRLPRSLHVAVCAQLAALRWGGPYYW